VLAQRGAPLEGKKNCTIGAVDRQECSLINHSYGGFTMVRFMGRALLLALVLSIPAVSAQAQYGRYGGWGGWGGGVGTAQGSMMRGAGVAAAGAGYYNQQTAVARSINANAAMQVNQYMYEVNKTNAKYFYTRSANKQVDSLLPQGAPNRLEADNYLKALCGLSKMLETPSVDQFLTGLNKVDSTTLGHLIAFMHTFNLRFGAAKTPVQEQTYDQLYPLLVAVRDQGKVPSANPYTTSSGPQDPKNVSAYFSGMQFDPKHGVLPPPPPPPGQP